MTEATSAAPGSGSPAVAPVADTSPLTITEARDLWRSRAPEPAESSEPVEREDAPDPRNSGDEPDAAPRKAEPSGENEDEPDPAEKPTIEPPRSWTKEEKEAFKALPPEHQQRIADRERAREVEIRRAQNEAAEQRKAAEVERNQHAAERQKYEAQLPVQLAAIQRQAETEFSDIRSVDDISRLAEEDPLRFTKWQALKLRYDAATNELTAVQERNARAAVEGFQKFAQEQDKTFEAKFPELKDPDTAAKTRKAAVEYLTDAGFTEDELGRLWNGQSGLSIRDARIQALILDGVKYRTAKANVAAAPKTAPAAPVQKPGVASNRADAGDDRIKELSRQLDKSGSIKDGLALFRALKKGA